MRLIVTVMLVAGVTLGQTQTGGAANADAAEKASKQSQMGELSPGDPNAEKHARENYQRSLEEIDKLIGLAMELKTDLAQQGSLTVSAKTTTRTTKDAQEIKKLADSIAKRIKSQ